MATPSAEPVDFPAVLRAKIDRVHRSKARIEARTLTHGYPYDLASQAVKMAEVLGGIEVLLDLYYDLTGETYIPREA